MPTEMRISVGVIPSRTVLLPEPPNASSPMRSKRLRTTQAHRELYHLKPIQDGEGFGLTALHFEAESGACTLALALEDWTIGMALRQDSQYQTDATLMRVWKAATLRAPSAAAVILSFRVSSERISNQPVCGSHIVPRIVRMPRIGSSIAAAPEHPPAMRSE